MKKVDLQWISGPFGGKGGLWTLRTLPAYAHAVTVSTLKKNSCSENQLEKVPQGWLKYTVET